MPALALALAKPRSQIKPFDVTLSMLLLIKTLGRILAIIPEIFSHAICVLLGDTLYLLMRKRRRHMISNLHHAFPNRSAHWMRKTARMVWRRTIEMGLYVLVSPYLSEERLDKTLILTEDAEKIIADLTKDQKPAIMLGTHNCLVETITLSPRASSYPLPDVGIFYRPLNQKKLDDFVRESRSRKGIQMLSRKEGLHQALKYLRSGKWVGILFDQNAGGSGRLGFFMNRAASTTDLPEILSHKFKADVVALYPERTGFWEANLHAEVVAKGEEKGPVMLRANQWLENRMRKDQEFCRSWLWLHNRWKFYTEKHEQFSLSYKRNQVEDVREFYGWDQLPKTYRLWMSLPNSLGSVIRLIPLIETLRRSRPDAQMTAVCHPRFETLLESLNVFDRLVCPKPSKGSRWQAGKDWHKEYIDTFLVLDDSLQSRIDARNSQSLLRFGWEKKRSRSSLLTHSYVVEKDWNEERHPEHELWLRCLRYFGMQGDVDFHTLKLGKDHEVINPLRCLQTESPDAPYIGLICGSGGRDQLCWPVDYWVELVAGLMDLYPQSNLCLFGSQQDQEISQRITEEFEVGAVHDFTGSTDLLQFAEALASCRLVIGNDSGGLHLANALGVPVIGLYGESNPIKNAPVFKAPKRIVQPQGAPACGGVSISHIHLNQVVEAVYELLEQPQSSENESYLVS